MTINNAVNTWKNAHMSMIATAMIERLASLDTMDDWQEVTTPVKGDLVTTHDYADGEILSVNDDGTYTIKTDDGKVNLLSDSFWVEHETQFPIHGTMFSFNDCFDDEWLANEDGIRIMSELGFRVFYSQEFGYFFGWDCGGYDTFEQMWKPLYKARGLQWHEE